MKKEITAHQFPKVYETLGIDLSKLGCIMLDLEGMGIDHYTGQDGVTSLLYSLDLYHAKDPAKFWIDGYVGDKPHITLMYGLITPANESPMRELVTMILSEGSPDAWTLDEVEIDHVGFFDSPYPDEPYWCIVAHIKTTPELIEGNERLKMLPHLNTFMGYKPHATVAYISQARGEEYRDNIIAMINQILAGQKLKVIGLNYGGNKDK